MAECSTQQVFLPFLFTVNIPEFDNYLAKDAKLLQGERVITVSKYTGEEQNIGLPLLPDVLLLKCVTGPLKNRLFLGKKKWLHHITDKCGNGCQICIKAISRGPIYLDDICKKENYMSVPTPAGGRVTLKSGSGNGQGSGGTVTICGGSGGTTGIGGAVTLQGGMGDYPKAKPATLKGSTQIGNLAAGDGTREMFFDASNGELLMKQPEKLDKNLSLKKEKLVLKQHLHANKCMMEERKQLSRERILIQCSKYKMLATLVRWLAASTTAVSCAYLLV
jgi:hypothetical protein